MKITNIRSKSQIISDHTKIWNENLKELKTICGLERYKFCYVNTVYAIIFQ